MSNLFEKMKYHQTHHARQQAVLRVMIDRLVYDENKTYSDAYTIAENELEGMTQIEVDELYAQYLLEEAFDEYRWRFED